MRGRRPISWITCFALGIVLVVLFGCPPPSSQGVPNILGMTEQAAREAIEDAGYLVGEVMAAPSATVLAGRVIDQNPTAGSQAFPGSRVDMTLSLGGAHSASQIEVIFETDVSYLDADPKGYTGSFESNVLLSRVGVTGEYAGSGSLDYLDASYTWGEAWAVMDLADGESAFRVFLRPGDRLPDVYMAVPQSPEEWITWHFPDNPPLSALTWTSFGWGFWTMAHMFSFGHGPSGYVSFPGTWEPGPAGSNLIARTEYTAQWDVGEVVATAEVTVELWWR